MNKSPSISRSGRCVLLVCVRDFCVVRAAPRANTPYYYFFCCCYYPGPIVDLLSNNLSFLYSLAFFLSGSFVL